MNYKINNILIVDDDVQILNILSKYLFKKNYNPIVTEKGITAIELFRKKKPELVLLDFRLPDINGLEVLKKFQKIDKDIPVVIISGNDSVKDAVSLIYHGAWDYITKPIIDLVVIDYTIEKIREKYNLLMAQKNYQKVLEEEVKNRTKELQVEIIAREKVENLYTILFESAYDGIFLIKDYKFVDCNQRILERFNVEKDEILGRGPIDFSPEFQSDGQHSDIKIKKLIDAAVRGESQFFEWKHQDLSGVQFDVEVALNGVKSNSEAYVMAVVRDITERKKNHELIQKLSMAINQSPSMVIITDINGIVEYVNPKFEEVTGYSSDEAIGGNINILKSGLMGDKYYKELWETITSGKEWRGEFHNKKKNGDLYWEYTVISSIKDEAGNIKYFIAVKEDITIRKEYEDKLMHQANYDPLTELPNRVLLLDRLNSAIDHTIEKKIHLALLLIDIDNFKKINDSFGHEAGDMVLIDIAQLLENILPRSSTVSRFSGDKFFIVLQDIKALNDIEAIAEKILLEFSSPFNVNESEIYVSASIGISMSPSDGVNAHVLMQNAELAMYRAKEEGKNRFNFFSKEIDAEVKDRLLIETNLRRALLENQMTVYFQPKVDLRTGKVVGAESLLRWQTSENNFISPMVFIPIAEDSGLISPIGEYVLEKSCQLTAHWNRTIDPDFKIAVNVSFQQFKDQRFCQRVFSIIEETGINPKNLEIEITESSLMQNVDETIEILNRFVEKGITIAVDDFGTGYSSLSYLKKFPANNLKIDKSFIFNITKNEDEVIICKTIIVMAHSLGLVVTAEGVENDEQLDFLKDHGCDYVQGYYYSKPIPADEFLEYMKKQSF